MKPIGRTTLALSLMLLTACSSRSDQPRVGPDPAGLRIQIENESAINLRVFAVLGNSELLLGRVNGGQHRNLRLPLGVSGNMSLIARSGAGPGQSGHRSEPFTLGPGQWMAWRLRDSPGTSDIRLSSVHVFSCDGEAVC